MRIVQIITIAATMSVAGRAYPIEQLVARSDAIVIAHSSAEMKAGRVVLFNLTVERVFHGAVLSGNVLSAMWNAPNNAAMRPNPPSYRGLWFLRKTQSGWECLGAQSNPLGLFELIFYPVPQWAPAELAYAEDAELSTKLLLEIGAARHRDPTALVRAAEGSTSPDVLRLFRYLSRSQESETMLAGIAGLLVRGDVGALIELERHAAVVGPTPGGAAVLGVLGSSYRQSDAVSIDALGRMATSKTTPRRLAEAAALALYSIHTAETLPYLALLLGSDEPMLQQYAVQGFGFFANGISQVSRESTKNMAHLVSRTPTAYRNPETEQYLGFDPSRRDEYVGFWRSWWESHPELHGGKRAW